MAKNTNAQNRGFAAMDDDKQREIASKGGKARNAKRSGSDTNRQGDNSGGTNRSGDSNDYHNS